MTNTLKTSAIALLVAFGLSACNTIAGAGEDIGAAGDAIENTSEENKTY